MLQTITRGQKELIKIIFWDRFSFRIAIVVLALFSSISGLLLPYFQKEFSTHLDFLTLTYCVVLSLVYFGFNQWAAYIGQIESIHAQRKLARTIYHHNLELKPLVLQNKSVGEIVSLYTTDVPSLTVWLEQSLPYGFTTLFPLILTPWFLFSFYDLPLKLSFSLIFLLVFINGAMAYRQSLFFYKFKQLAANRMGLVNEWIQNIRGLKILGWLEGFENQIIKKRREETLNRLAMVTNGQVMNSISSSVTFWLNLSVLMFFIWIEPKPLSKVELIALLWVTTVFLSRPLRQLPWFFTFIFDAWTSYKRIRDFLDLKNQNEIILDQICEQPGCKTSIRNLELSLAGEIVLQIKEFKILKPEIIALVGPVASGKSLFLKSLIRETSFTASHFYTASITYVPQEHFVMSATLRDNVSFEYGTSPKFDSSIMNSLKKAQFDFQLDRVENGLETIIGERGLNLSGGQKQRVSIARQFENLKELVLLDDPLSAVDISTEAELIHEFINLKNQGHSVMLTTQRFSALRFCDRVVYLEKGQIHFDGTAEAFLSHPNFQTFLKGAE
ncbi:MAG: hypothetical protein A2622_01100 [Bdellovibrionales bacterium RIFCSPHIGHO2_01_FULL_40_29]|nr:MAG: hypothetical protein A2622_01100 [Bdellovibrionales bacterium RIFCSPHIGHO2_01_FULL_40_29]OFZ32711.1 MAG: hypothetical protein A3D17_05700 [Bdellovibrionales bacterium RIFCSPHIGHO2_02_FULL_40_15]